MFYGRGLKRAKFVLIININQFVVGVNSRAIMCYLANKYAPNSSLYPSDPQRRAVVDRVLQWDLGVLYRSIGEYLAPIMRDGKTLSNLDPEKEKKIKESLQILDDSLAVESYVAGDNITLADLSILASLSLAEVFDYNMTNDYKYIKQWNEGLKRNLPYYDEVNKEPINMFKEYVNSKIKQNANNQ